MPIVLESPYPKQDVTWLRGNLHAHTTRSDGRLEAQEVLRRYAALGYDFMAFADHNIVSDYRGLDPCGMVLLPCNEVSGAAHILDVGATRRLPESAPLQQILDDINGAGGFPVLCHPNIEADFNHYPYETLAILKGYAGIEILNGESIEGEGYHLALDKWDRLLAAGRKVWGFANDDAHRPTSIGRAWNMVAAPERSAPSILQALRQGSFYASSGVGIRSIVCDGAVLRVAAPEAQRISVFGRAGRRLFFCDAPELAFDTTAVDGPFVRVECYGRHDQVAWTQPIFIRGGLHDQRQEKLARSDALTRAVLHAFRSDAAPRLTGDLSDPIWRQAPAFSSFKDMSDAGPVPVKTQVQAIRAGGELFIGVRCEEPELEKMQLGADKAMWTTDSVEMFLDDEGRGVSCYQVGISADGVIASDVRGATSRAPLKIRGKAARYRDQTGSGWCAELVLPLPQLKDAPPGTRYGFHVCRNRYPVRGHFVWSWVGNSNHNREQYGSLIL